MNVVPELPVDDKVLVNTLLNTSSEAIFAINKLAECVFINQAALDLFGLKKSDCIGISMHILTHYKHPDGSPYPENKCTIIKKFKTGKKITRLEDIFWTKKGERFYGQLSLTPFLEKKEVVGAIINIIDISEQKQMEQIRSHIAAIVQSSDDAIIGKDLEGRITNWNKGAEKIYGYKSEEIIGKTVSILMPPNKKSDFPQIMNQIKKRKKVDHYETQRMKKDGTIIDISVTVSPIVDFSGKIIGASTIASDITLLKQNEALIKKSEENFRQLADAIPEMIWVADIAGNPIYINKRWQEFTHFTQKQLLKPGVIGKLLHPDDYQITYKTWEKAAKIKKPFSIEYRVRQGKKDQYTWFWAQITPILDGKGKIEKWVGTITNVDKQKRTEEELKRSEKLYRLVVENTTDLTTLFNTSGKIVYASPSYKKILGYNPKEVIGLNIFNSNTDIETITRFKQILKGEGISNFVTKSRHKNGQLVSLEANGSAIFSDEGKPYLVVSTAHDISERLELERRKDEFISTASHELRTPITTIKSFAQILLKISNDEKTKYYLDKMNGQIDRLTQLINDLLDVSRIESGKLVLNKERVEITDLIKDIVEDMQYTSNNHVIVFKNDVEQILEIDKYRINQVVVNLISNAIKFSPHATKVNIQIIKNRSNIVVRVQDFGIGIHKKDQAKIFEPFFQASNKIRQSYSGLGLGLHICSEIIRRHGGKIWVESEKGTGSTFSFSLPINTNHISSVNLVN